MYKYLDKITDFCFLVGMISSKFQNLPFPMLALGIKSLSLTSYLVGYVAWYVSSLFYKNYSEKNFTWIKYLDFKQQYQLAALLGTVATVMSIFFPALIIPVAWLYMISNTYWHIGEVYRKKHPFHTEDNYSEARQQLNCYRTLLITLVSLITAITETLIYLFPVLTITIVPITFIVVTLLSVAAFGLLLKTSFGKFEADCNLPENTQSSFSRMQASLKGNGNTLKQSLKESTTNYNQPTIRDMFAKSMNPQELYLQSKTEPRP